jgi:hypothetical protein
MRVVLDLHLSVEVAVILFFVVFKALPSKVRSSPDQ